jgi:hypothetical protein
MKRWKKRRKEEKARVPYRLDSRQSCSLGVGLWWEVTCDPGKWYELTLTLIRSHLHFTISLVARFKADS